MSDDGTYLYIIGRREGPIKVGITSKPIGRLKMLGTGCPFPIAILHLRLMDDRDHARWHEKCVHAACAQHRLSGEWFDMSCNEAVEQIETSIQKWFYLEQECEAVL